eukprot:260129-Chlamydomonas_euryale.AAC.2
MHACPPYATVAAATDRMRTRNRGGTGGGGRRWGRWSLFPSALHLVLSHPATHLSTSQPQSYPLPASTSSPVLSFSPHTRCRARCRRAGGCCAPQTLQECVARGRTAAAAGKGSEGKAEVELGVRTCGNRPLPFARPPGGLRSRAGCSGAGGGEGSTGQKERRGCDPPSASSA